MNKKTIERIAVFALAALLVGYFIYQVAYGYTIGRNGTMTVTNSTNRLSATFTAPPGSTIKNVPIIQSSAPSQQPVTINFTDVTTRYKYCANCFMIAFTIHDPTTGLYYKGYNEWAGPSFHTGGPEELIMCAHKRDMLKVYNADEFGLDIHNHTDPPRLTGCVYLPMLLF